MDDESGESMEPMEEVPLIGDWVSQKCRAIIIIIIIIIIIKDIYLAQVRRGHKCAMSAEMAVWLRNCLYLYSYLSHN